MEKKKAKWIVFSVICYIAIIVAIVARANGKRDVAKAWNDYQ